MAHSIDDLAQRFNYHHIKGKMTSVEVLVVPVLSSKSSESHRKYAQPNARRIAEYSSPVRWLVHLSAD